MDPLSRDASATVIGDLVGSRSARDRATLHRRLGRALSEVNRALDPVTPLRPTVGDEYQGVFATVGAALTATLLLRVALLPAADARHGVGWGPVRVLSERPRIEDGPGWWAARDAIEAVEQAQGRPVLRSLRTAYVVAEDTGEAAPGPEPRAINAALRLRDQLVSGLSPRSVSVLRGLLEGSTQQAIAAAEGISASAVSQRVRHDGLGVLLAAHHDLGAVE